MVAIPPSLAALLVRSLAGATAAEVGEALDLPTFSVEMRLAELAGDPVPYRAFARRFADNTNTPFFGTHKERK